jgi:hypothetical protein
MTPKAQVVIVKIEKCSCKKVRSLFKANETMDKMER